MMDKRVMQPCTAEYTIHDIIGDIVYKVPERSCGMCEHCTDVFWDFTHGPYMFYCEKQTDVYEAGGPYGNCDDFERKEEKQVNTMQ